MNTTFSFLVTPTNIDAPVGITVKHNDQTVFDTDYLLESKTVCIDIDDETDDVEHTISITLKNKTAIHTKVDEQGNIIADSLIAISAVSISDVEIDQLFFEKSQYMHSFNNDAVNTIIDEFFGVMGCNGTVEFKFVTPTYIWLLENL
jgi:hypothetical protein